MSNLQIRSITLAALAAAVWVVPARAATVPVTTCGQVVAGTGALIADLDCSGHAGSAVYLRGKLLLSGFTLTGNPAHDVVRCEVGACRVEGPGTVTGGMDGVRSDRGALVLGATISGNAGDGVRTDASARLKGAIVAGNGGDGVRSKSGASVDASSITGNGGDGVRADGSARLRGSTITGNAGNGVDAERPATAHSSTVSANGLDGIKALKTTLVLGTIATGNGTSGACGVSESCADVASGRRPAVRSGSSCGTSRNTELGGTWGVCAND